MRTFIILLIVYIICVVICCGLSLPFVEKYFKDNNINPDKNPTLERRCLYLSLLGPVGLWAVLVVTNSKFCGFRFIRKHKNKWPIQ